MGVVCPTWHGAHDAAREAAGLLTGAKVLLADQARSRGRGEVSAAGEDGGVVVVWGGGEPEASEDRSGGYNGRSTVRDDRGDPRPSRWESDFEGGTSGATDGGNAPLSSAGRPEASSLDADRVAPSRATYARAPSFPIPPPVSFGPAAACFPLEDFCRRRLRRDPLVLRHAAVVLDLVDQRSLLGDALLGLFCVLLRRWGNDTGDAGGTGDAGDARRGKNDGGDRQESGGGGGDDRGRREGPSGTAGEAKSEIEKDFSRRSPAVSLPFRLVVCVSPADAPQLVSYLSRSLGRALPLPARSVPLVAPDELPHVVRTSYLSQPCSDLAETAAETAAQLCAMLADLPQDRERQHGRGTSFSSSSGRAAGAAAVAVYLPSRGACERASRTFRRLAEDRGLDGRVQTLVAFPTAPSSLRAALGGWGVPGDDDGGVDAGERQSTHNRFGARTSYARPGAPDAPRFRARDARERRDASPGLRVVFAAVDPSKDGEPARLAVSGASYLIDGMLEGVTVAGPASGTVFTAARPVGPAEALRRAALVARRGPARIYRLCTRAWFEKHVLGAEKSGDGGDERDASDADADLAAAALRAPAPAPSAPASSLADLFLLLLSLGVSNPIAFPWPRPPSGVEAVRALETLHALGALDASARLRTPLGTRLARLPLRDPCLSLLVLRGVRQGMAREAAWIAACAAVARDGVGGGSVFRWSGSGGSGSGGRQADVGAERGRPPSVHPARARLSSRFNPSEAPSAAFACAEGDCVAFLNVRRAWLAAGRSAAWTREAGLSPAALVAAERVFDAVSEALDTLGVAGHDSETLLAPGLPPPAVPEAVERLSKVVAGGLFLRAARLDQDAQTAAGEPVYRALKEASARGGTSGGQDAVQGWGSDGWGPSSGGISAGSSAHAALTLHPSSVFASPGVETPAFVVFAVAERIDKGIETVSDGRLAKGTLEGETYQMRCVQAIRPEWLSEVAPHVFTLRNPH